MDGYPDTIVFDSPTPLRNLRSWVGVEHMPTVDIDWFYQQLFAAVSTDGRSYQQELYGTADRMAYGDLLWGHNDVTDRERDELCQGIIAAGHAVVESLLKHRAYNEHGVFPYRFSEFRHDGLLIFRYTRIDEAE